MTLANSKEKLPEKTQQLSGKLSSPSGKETLGNPKQCNIC